MEDEINLIDNWRVIWNYKKFILCLFFISVITAMVISLLMPKVYRAKTVVLPPETKGTTLINIPGIASRILPSLKGGSTPTDIIVAMLKSRRMKENIIKEFNLREFYKVNFLEDALKKLGNSTNINVSKENTISISVDSTEPELASNIANLYVQNLDRINEDLKLTTENPIVKVLDIANIPEKKYKPRIKINMVISGLTSLFLGIFISFLKESYKKVLENEQ